MQAPGRRIAGLFETDVASPLGPLVVTLAIHGTSSDRYARPDRSSVTRRASVVGVSWLERSAWMRSRVVARFAGLPWLGSVASPAPDAWELAELAAPVGAALTEYFGGRLDALDAVSSWAGGTPFQARVYDALRAIPPGETRSYGDLARLLRTSPRAVGNANGKNPVSLFVPCHRVIATSGALTGYAFGTHRKAWLLAHERRGEPAREAPCG